MRELIINNHVIPYQVRKGAKGRIAIKLQNGILHITTESGELKDFDNAFIKKKKTGYLNVFLRS